MVASAIAAMTPAWWVFIILVILLYLILGTFLTPSEIILVTVPVLLPVATAVGVHPIHFGMVCVAGFCLLIVPGVIASLTLFLAELLQLLLRSFL